MMVPSMQAVLINTIMAVAPWVRVAHDPFVGSGTTLVESMRHGLDFYGRDINPFAVLLSSVKRGPFKTKMLERTIENVFVRVSMDKRSDSDVVFPGISKWFEPEVIMFLSKIRRAILNQEDKWCRRVLWVALAETIRFTSNSRTSTYKLHVRSSEDLRTREVDVFKTFKEFSLKILDHFKREREILGENKLLNKLGGYLGESKIVLGDSVRPLDKHLGGQFDLIITSPPYGDNTTTVPYGQYSYLALQWIELGDIDLRLKGKRIDSAYEIDAISLGGIRKGALAGVESLRTESPSLERFLRTLKFFPVDRMSRVVAFCKDLNLSLDGIVQSLNQNGYMVWITGNRRVGGSLVPLDQVLSEFLEARGVRPITKINRNICGKRMAIRNNIAGTMKEETILLFRKE